MNSLAPGTAQSLGSMPVWAWIAIAAGLLFSLLAGFGAVIASRRSRWIERLVGQRTAELAQINEKLAEEICDHLNTEHALDKERESLRAVLDNLNEGILVLDTGGTVSSANGAALTIYRQLAGVELEDLEQLSPFDFYGSPERGRIRGDHWPHVRALAGATVRDYEITIESRHRAPAVLSINAQPLITSDGRQHGAIMVVRDVTDRKRVERLKAEFVATVSHELRTPITSIRGSLGLLAGGATGPLLGKTKHLIDIALRNSDRLSHLINDLLDIEKIESGHMRFEVERQALGELIAQAIEANAGYAQAFDVRLHFDHPVVDSTVIVDPYRLLQVLANLLSNAVKFSPKGSTVTVSVQASSSDVRVSVSDRGSGIPADFHTRIFQKFSQADSSDARNRSGTGLGLAVCKAIVEQMHGTIGFDTAPDKGTTFYFDLPVEVRERESEGARESDIS